MPIEILTNKDMSKVLTRPGQAGGLPRHVHDELVEKMASLGPNFLEPKGYSGKFFGIDLTGAHRAIFTVDEQRRPVLVYAGPHDQYSEYSDLIRSNPQNLRAHFLNERLHQVAIESKKLAATVSLEEFSNRFRQALQPS